MHICEIQVANAFSYLYHWAVEVVLIHSMHSNENQRWYFLYPDGAAPPAAALPRHRLALTLSTDESAHALFLVGAGGGFLSPETLVPLLALPGKLHCRAYIKRGIPVSGEKHYMLSSPHVSRETLEEGFCLWQQLTALINSCCLKNILIKLLELSCNNLLQPGPTE